MNMTIPEAIEVLRNFKLNMSQPDAFRMVHAIGMAEKALKTQLALNEILEKMTDIPRSNTRKNSWIPVEERMKEDRGCL